MLSQLVWCPSVPFLSPSTKASENWKLSGVDQKFFGPLWSLSGVYWMSLWDRADLSWLNSFGKQVLRPLLGQTTRAWEENLPSSRCICSLLTSGNTSALWGSPSTVVGCPERLWDLHPLGSWEPSWVTLLEEQLGQEALRRSLPPSSTLGIVWKALWAENPKKRSVNSKLRTSGCC